MSLYAKMFRAPTLRIAPASSRTLSTQCSESLEKLRQVFEEYRMENFTREIPSRFKKEMVKAAGAENHVIAPEGLERLLSNIGASHRLSDSDKKIIFSELGESPSSMSAQRFAQII